MILPQSGKESDPAAKAEEKEEGRSESELSDVIGKQSMGTRKLSASIGAQLEEISGKSAEEEKQILVKEDTDVANKLNDLLEKENVKRELQKKDTTPSKISEIDVINQDPYLKPFEAEIRYRNEKFKEWLKKFEESEHGIIEFAGSYTKFGLNRVKGGIQYREWAPCAKKVCLCGDFNGWNRSSHECKRNEFGVWELLIPDLSDGVPAIKHGTKVKAFLILANGQAVSNNIQIVYRLIVTQHG